MASALVGASRVEQIEQCVGAVNNVKFAADELQCIDGILAADR
jgi:aryl-alcohol dehydrogenase-like predicted oxidoreductase